ncbi:MAG: hypothetical protein AAGA75_09720 [Cyanobacteria bacterium P01_E01_bin.6]
MGNKYTTDIEIPSDVHFPKSLKGDRSSAMFGWIVMGDRSESRLIVNPEKN